MDRSIEIKDSESRVSLSRKLVVEMAKQLHQHAKIWGPDEDLSVVLEDFQGEMEAIGEEVLVDLVVSEDAQDKEVLPSIDIMSSSHVLIEKKLQLPSDHILKHGSAPDYQVFGPICGYSSVCHQAEDIIGDDGNSVSFIGIRVIAEIDHDVYKIMLEMGLIEDPDQPFDMKLSDPEWISDIPFTENIRLI
jgi:hypothetical protein